MANLKQKTIGGLAWSFIDFFAKQGFNFIIGIILARLLSPEEFGLVGLAAIFIAISQTFVDSGFSQALIRKNNCTQVDFSTVFYFNVLAGIVIYSTLVLLSEPISLFFDEPELKQIIIALGIGLIFSSFSVVQLVTLTKDINFKLQTKISIFSTLISGATGIVMAIQGFGVWSLVFKSLANFLITAILLWLCVKWRPSFVFSKDSFFEMFTFGSRLLVSGLMNALYTNAYLITIGKFYSTSDLGFYTRAEQFNRMLSQSITGVIQRVSFPALSIIQDDIPRLKSAYQKLIKCSMLISFTLMMGMAAVAEPMILFLVGDKWAASVKYLQLLCFVGMLYPIHAINLNMLLVQGNSILFLRLSIIRKLFVIPVIYLGINYGIEFMIMGMIFNGVLFLYVNSYYSGKKIGYSGLDQLLDILPSFLMALFMASIVFLSGLYLTTPVYLSLFIQTGIGIFLFFILNEVFRADGYLLIRGIVFDYLENRKHHG